MTETKKQQAFREQVAAEDPYSRAAATWVARRIGVDPSRVAGVDFEYEDGYAYSAETWEPGRMVLVFSRFGKPDLITFADVTPGEFIRECSEILKEAL